MVLKTEGFKNLKETAEELAYTNPVRVPEESKFLLEIDETKTVHGTYSEMKYWIGTIEAAKISGQRRVDSRRE